MDVAACDSALVIYNEKVLKRMAVPSSPVLSVEVSEGFQQFGRHEDFIVFLFHLDQRIAEFNHCFLVGYDELVVRFAYPEKLICVG